MEKNNPALIEFRQVRKVFGSVVANDEVNLQIKSGSIHAIVGENGAGKSTAMKLLYAQYAKSAGEILFRGNTTNWKSPRDAIHAGIGMVHQHFMLAETHTALENILLESDLPFWKPYGKKEARARLTELAKKYHLEINFDALVSELSVGEQQRLEILKLLYANSEVLILDEPTAVLTPQEIIALFENLRRLRAEGKTILLITHKLKEVMQFADCVTVFRAGRVVAHREVIDTSTAELADLMVGQKVELGRPWPIPCKPREAILSLEEISYPSAGSKLRLDGINLQVQAGEIVGIAGVEGNGQSDLIRFLLSPKEFPHQGTIRLFGEPIDQCSAPQVRKKSVGLLAEDRLKEALLLNRDLEANFLLGNQGAVEFQRRGILQKKEILKTVHHAIEEYDVRPRKIENSARSFSGGNQQKFVVARELYRKPKFLLAAQPTRGVDVGAIEFIHRKLFEARDAGAGILLISSELEEVLRLSDRVLVMFAGKIVAEFSRATANESNVGLAMMGGKRANYA